MTGQEDDRYLLSLRQSVRLILVAVAIRLIARFGVSVLARTFWVYVSNIVAVAGFTWLLIQFSDIVVSASAAKGAAAHLAALKQVSGMVLREALTLAYNDCLAWMAVAFFVAIPLTFFLAKPNSGAGAEAH